MKLNRETKVLLLTILKSGEITEQQAKTLFDFLQASGFTDFQQIKIEFTKPEN
jgi:hypothetical protein